MYIRPRCFKRLLYFTFAVLFLIMISQLYIFGPYWKGGRNPNMDDFSYFSSPVNFLSLNGSDDSRYRIWPYVWRNRGDDVEEIVLGVATQCSLSNMKDILVLSKYWRGPISLTVFVEGGDIPLFAKKLNYYVRCHPAVADRVSVHVVVPISRPPSEMDLDVNPANDDGICSTFVDPPVLQSNYDNTRVPYPVNLLRNVAVSNLRSKYVLVLDVDMIPSDNLLSEVLKSHVLDYELSALVIPAFEIRSSNFIPANKRHLIQLWREQNIRPFYKDVCWKCQKYTLYDKWEAAKEDSSAPPYLVQWQDPWEPFYVALRHHVKYDERFEQYGFNRISQLCHMHMKGTNFYVSQSTFLLHVGFKMKSSFHRTKDLENQKNKVIYRKVKSELLDGYRSSGRHC